MPERAEPAGSEPAVDPIAGLPPLEGVTATVALQVNGVGGGDRSVIGRWVEGRPVEAAGAEARVTFSISAADAEEVASGRLSPSVAFMQGRLKTSGDPGLVIAILAATATPAFEQWLGAPGGRDRYSGRGR